MSDDDVPGPPPGDLTAPPAPPGGGASKDDKAGDKPAAAAGKPAGDGKDAAADAKTYVGFCLCKLVKVQATGLPTFSGFCHCTICSKHGGTDRGLVAGWEKGKVVVLEGKEHVTSYKSSDRLTRSFCKACGTGLIGEGPNHSGLSPAVFSEGDSWRLPKELAPQVHIHYGSSCLLGAIKDGSGLPLFKDAPKQIGGSGDMIKE